MAAEYDTLIFLWYEVFTFTFSSYTAVYIRRSWPAGVWLWQSAVDLHVSPDMNMYFKICARRSVPGGRKAVLYQLM